MKIKTAKHFSKKPIILVDGTFYFYQSFYAYPNLTNKNGESTNGIYGVLKVIKKLHEKYKPSHMAIIFDHPKKNNSFRQKIYKNYKKNRNSMPKNLQKQISPLFFILKALGFSVFSIPNVEADDIIGTLATKLKEKNYILISTEDKDFIQLISPKIYLTNSKLNNFPDNTNNLTKKFGIKNPSLIVDYLALTGDNSDNIPGIFGIGNKTASILIKNFGNLHKIYQNINEIKTLKIKNYQKIISSLNHHKKLAFISYKLAKIKTNISFNWSKNSLKIKKQKKNIVTQFFQHYEFKTWLNSVNSTNTFF